MAGWSPIFVALGVLTAGIVAWGLSKFIPMFLFYRHANKQLRRFPHHKPVHWLLGNATQIGSPEGFMVFYMKRMKEYGRIFCAWMAHNPILFVCHPETIREAIKKTEIKPKGYSHVEPWIGDGLLLSSGQKWERNRKLLTPAFHFDILKPYVKVYQEAAQICADQMWNLAGGGGEKSPTGEGDGGKSLTGEGGDGKSLSGEGGNGTGGKSVEISEPLGLLTLDIMLTCALSFKTDLQVKGHPYEKAVERLMNLVMIRSLTLVYMLSDTIWWLSPHGREFRSLCDYAHSVSGNIIQARQDQLKNDPDSIKKRHLDFLDILLTAKDENGQGLTFKEIRDEVDTFMFEGHDTTKAGLSWCIYCLAKYPDEQQKVFEEVREVFGDREQLEWEDLQRLNYTSLFVKEVMRLYPPAPQVARQTSGPVTIQGVEIPKGIQLELLIYAMHRNPLVWSDPEKFDPNRFKMKNFADHDPFSYVPFSAGQRNCIGQVFALNEVKTVLACLLRRFEFGFDEEHEKHIILQPLATLKSKNGIKVKIRERSGAL